MSRTGADLSLIKVAASALINARLVFVDHLISENLESFTCIDDMPKVGTPGLEHTCGGVICVTGHGLFMMEG